MPSFGGDRLKTQSSGLAGLLVLLFLSGCAGDKRFARITTPLALRAEMQAPLDEAESAALTKNTRLHEIIPLALQRNPGVEAERRRWLSKINVEPQATSLSDPMVQFGYEFKSVETRVGPQEWNMGASQRIPWWRKLWAQGKIAATESDISRLRYEAAARDLVINVKDSYYELYYIDQASTITQKIEALMRNEGVLAYAELGSGRTQLNEAFRAESQTAQLAYDRILLQEQRTTQAERLRSLLNLPPGTAIGPVDSAPVYEVADNLPVLFERAESYAEILKIRGLEIQKARYDTYLAKLAQIPDITIGSNFIETGPSRAAMKPKDSGKDPFIGLISINLPIWWQRNQALIREKKAIEDEMERHALEEVNTTRKAVANAYFQVTLSGRLMELYHKTLLPQADKVMHQAEIDFRNDQSSYSNVLETTLAYHNFLLAYQRASADHGEAIGRLEKVLGTTAEPRTLENAPAPPGNESK